MNAGGRYGVLRRPLFHNNINDLTTPEHYDAVANHSQQRSCPNPS